MDVSADISKPISGGRRKTNLQTHLFRPILGLQMAIIYTKNMYVNFRRIRWTVPVILAKQSWK